jgi:hypothetical protein
MLNKEGGLGSSSRQGYLAAARRATAQNDCSVTSSKRPRALASTRVFAPYVTVPPSELPRMRRCLVQKTLGAILSRRHTAAPHDACKVVVASAKIVSAMGPAGEWIIEVHPRPNRARIHSSAFMLD